MATLVLTTVGTALGGPLGGALGGLIGGSFDRGLFGGGARRGPRLGDLAVQTSSYGSQIPRIYGRMRVAGTVVWATDLKEEESIEGGGKGSPERLAYSYSASLAVALSSRSVAAVRRIWADGKLIRGASGNFTVETGFRLLTGSEDQPVDPLIASVETVVRTPAYRGLALAIFEDLQLVDFGNRIPMLTFEVEAEAEPIALSQLLADASDGVIEASDSRPIAGFAAYGSSIGESIRPLVEVRGLALTERAGKLRSPSPAAPIRLTEVELGCDAEDQRQAKVENIRVPDADLPASLLLAYHDPERDYQAGQMRASSGGGGRREERLDLPAVLPADQAKQWVEECLARRWQAAHSIRLRLPPSRMELVPGQTIQLPGLNIALSVRNVTIEGMAVIVEATPSTDEMVPLPADGGRPVSDPDVAVGRSEVALFELPSTSEQPGSAVTVLAAASNDGKWKRLAVEMRHGLEVLPTISLPRRAVLGTATSILEDRSPATLDAISSLTVRLANSDQILLNADADALMSGANLAISGDEIFQFGRADQLGPGLFRLSNLLRGRRATEWAAASHMIGERFCLLDSQAGLTIDLPSTAVGGMITAIAHGVGDSAPLPDWQRSISGEAMRPPSVCHLRLRCKGGELHASWVRRSHRSWAWSDGIGDSHDGYAERYRVVATGPAGELATETDLPAVRFPQASLPARAGETVNLAVHCIGPMAISRARSANIII